MEIYKLKNFINKIFLFFIFFFLFTNKAFAQGLFNPKGFIANEQKSIFCITFFLMLLIVCPVIFMTLFFFYKYSYNDLSKKYFFSKNSTQYSPNWNSSHKIELFSWGSSLIVIFFLAILSWNKTHDLDPRKFCGVNQKPVFINVVSIDWKWLFIYPKDKVISVNEVFLPINTPIIFNITSTSSMNSFFIPQLGSQMYAMPGMVTKLNLIANYSGKYKGISSNYSGFGFSDMKFDVIVSSNKKFLCWINKIKVYNNFIKSLEDIKKISKNNDEKYFCYYLDEIFQKIIENVRYKK